MKISRLIILLTPLLYFSPVSAQALDTLINIGSCKLHFKIIKGSGTPILFESGGAMDAAQWDAITAALHKATGATTITYDRQGFGKSGLDTLHYSIINEIKGLELGLQKLGYAHKPVIGVCHSLGNFYIRLYAAQHPQLVKGIVMLDPRIPSAADALHARQIFASLDQAKLKQAGLIFYFLLRDIEKNSLYVSHALLPTNTPMLDIMAENGPFTTIAENKQFKTDQIKFIKKRINSRLIFAKGSSHNIAHDKPQLVIAQIIAFIKSHRTKGKANS